MLDEAKALCPFFLATDKKFIVCEGITDECKTKIMFRNGDARNRHRSIFCDAKFENCEVYRMLEEKYEWEE